jgi:hypothetical protein
MQAFLARIQQNKWIICLVWILFLIFHVCLNSISSHVKGLRGGVVALNPITPLKMMPAVGFEPLARHTLRRDAARRKLLLKMQSKRISKGWLNYGLKKSPFWWVRDGCHPSHRRDGCHPSHRLEKKPSANLLP